jgi:uncharacterized protein
MNKKLLEIIACPSCKGRLIEQDHELICQLDRLAFPISSGVPVLLIERARSLKD